MKKPEKNWLEWSVFAVSLVLIAGVIAVLLLEARSPDTPADLVLSLGQVRQGETGFTVPVTVANHGGRTAEQVNVEVVLHGDGGEVEEGELTVAFVPRHSSRDGAVVFTKDPRSGKLEGRITGYESP